MKKSSGIAALMLAVCLMAGMTACGGQESPVSDVSEGTGGSTAPTDTGVSGDSTGGTGVATGATAPDGSRPPDGPPPPGGPAKPPSGNNGGTTKTVAAFGQRPSSPKGNYPKVMDMKGATLTIGTKWIERFGNEKAGTSAQGDKWIEWRKNFEKTFNCKLKNVYVSNYTLFDSLSTKIMAGEKVADILTVQLFDVEGFRHAGLLQPLQDAPNLNLDHPLVIQDMVNNFTFGGRSYLYAAVDAPSEVNGLYVNRDMVKSLGLKDPFKLAKDKQWTWKAFDEMCAAAYKDLNGNNKVDAADRFGSTLGELVTLGSLRVSRVQAITYNNGKFSYTYNTPKTLQYINNIKATLNAGNRTLPAEASSQGFAKFAKGELLFCEGESNVLGMDKENPIWDAEFAYGYLPTPTHEAGMGYSNSCSTWLGGYSIPKNTDQLLQIGYLLNAITDMEASLSSLNRAEQLRMFGGDKESFDLFMSYCRKFTPDVYCWQSEFKLLQVKFAEVLSDKSMTAAKYLESIDSPMKNAIKDYYAKDPDLMS